MDTHCKPGLKCGRENCPKTEHIYMIPDCCYDDDDGELIKSIDFYVCKGWDSVAYLYARAPNGSTTGSAEIKASRSGILGHSNHEYHAHFL